MTKKNNQHPLDATPEAIIMQARRMQRDTVILGLRIVGHWAKKVLDEIIDAHRRRKLMLELVEMDRDQLTDIGVLPGGIKEFVAKVSARQAQGPAANDVSAGHIRAA